MTVHYLFVLVKRRPMNPKRHKIAVFHANQTSMCLDPHSKGEVGAVKQV